MAAVPRFAGFTPGALRLLGGLERHNDRAWFASRKERFERELLEPMRALVVDTSAALAKAKLPLQGDPQRSVFRIYRDVRFTPDKRPYKTNLAAYLSADGGRRTPGGLYVHVAAAQAYVAAAFYGLEAPLLQRWRERMAADPLAFIKVLRVLDRRGLPLLGPAQWDDSLVRMPRGFAAMEKSELAPYFRLRSFVVRRTVAPEDVLSAAFVDRIVDVARDAKPLFDYGHACFDKLVLRQAEHDEEARPSVTRANQPPSH